jgi:hypothetical protein
MLPEFDQPMDREAIRNQLDRILRSESFADKDQLQKLLEVLFNHMDSPASLKPDRIIRELWPEEVKTKGSADVATEMNRLRRALKTYYETEGRTDPILVTLPNRTAPAPDGIKERRWIVAEPRRTEEVFPPLAAPPFGSIPPDTHIRPDLPVSKHSPVSRVRSQKGLIVAAATVAFGVVTFIAVRALTADSRPQSGRIDNSELVIMNAEGKELWRKTFPGGFWSKYYEDGIESHLFDQDGLQTHLWFGDLEGDGHTSVLFLYHPATDPKSHSTTLICYSDSGQEKWRWSPGRVLPELSSVPSVYITMGFGVLPSTPGQRRRIVVMSRHEYYYPTQIAIVDSNGNTLSEYWHSGHLFHFALATLAGREEIVASGISNGYHQATLLVLDPDHVSGASTEIMRPELQIHGMGVPHERFRLLFPRSDLNRDLYLYNEGLGAVLSPGRIQIDVKECWLTVPQGCTIVYGFDDNFNLLSADAEDTFLNAHKEYYSKNKVDHPFSSDEDAQFQKVSCLAGCNSKLVPVKTP